MSGRWDGQGIGRGRQRSEDPRMGTNHSEQNKL